MHSWFPDLDFVSVRETLSRSPPYRIRFLPHKNLLHERGNYEDHSTGNDFSIAWRALRNPPGGAELGNVCKTTGEAKASDQMAMPVPQPAPEMTKMIKMMAGSLDGGREARPQSDDAQRRRRQRHRCTDGGPGRIVIDGEVSVQRSHGQLQPASERSGGMPRRKYTGASLVRQYDAERLRCQRHFTSGEATVWLSPWKAK